MHSSLTQFVENNSHVINKAFQILNSKAQTKQSILPKLLDSWRIISTNQNSKNEECGHLFNPFKQIPISETIHSRVLGDLLNPKGTHGQNSKLLTAFLELIGVPGPFTGEWMVSVEAARVDICMWRKSPASVIIIENKSNSANDQPNQLYRYWYESIYQRYPMLDYSNKLVRNSFQIIYMPPTGEKMPSYQSLQRPTYLEPLGLPESLNEIGVMVKLCTFQEHIVKWLNRCEKHVPTANHRLSHFLQFYKEIWT